MIDPELKHSLDKITASLGQIRRGIPWWKALLNGVLSGLGSVLGVAIAIVVLSWILNIIGIIPAAKREVSNWQKLLQQTQQQRLPSTNRSAQ
jgi:hypothetical protein